MTCKVFSFFIGSAFCASSIFAKPLELGAKIPEVSCLNQAGESVSLPSFASEKWLLVYFYPKAGTPGCTKQACSLRDTYEQLVDAGVKVIGVSSDSLENQKEFAEKYKLPFLLLADADKKVISSFGVPGIKLMGGLAKRQAYLFKQGELVWRDLKASTKEQAVDVLAQISK